MLRKSLNRLYSFTDKKIGWILLVTAFLLRLAFSIYSYHNNVMAGFKDDQLYYRIAQHVLEEGKIFYKTTDLSFEIIGPGLPWINALTMFVFGQNWLGMFFITSLVSGLITLFTYKVAIKVTNKSTALLAGLWSCLYLYYYKYAPTSGKDIWMSFFMIVSLWFLIEFLNEKRFYWPKLIFFTLIYVYSIYLDERFAVFAPFILLFVLVSETSSFTVLKLSRTLTFALLVLLLILPWSIRNYQKFGKIVLFTFRTERITDRIFGYEHIDRPYEWIYDTVDKFYIKDSQIDSVLSRKKTITDGGFPITEDQRKAMLKGRLPGSISIVKGFWIRVKVLLQPFQWRGEYQKNGYYYVKYSFRHNVASLFFYGIMFLFSIPGFFFLFKSNREVFILSLSIIVIYTLIHAFFIPWTIERYRLPLDAIFIILGSYGIVEIYRKLKARQLVIQ
jgi:4-amino-4-deoxy-L-arabinose transferase-like glycosyltransferase